jgi:hypothetical protein
MVPPNKIKYDHQAYPIAYWMALSETGKITANIWSPRSHTNGCHCHMTLYGLRERYLEPNSMKPLTKMVTEWCIDWSRNYRWTAHRTESWATMPEAYPTSMTRHRIFYVSRLPNWSQRVQTRMHRSHHRNDFYGDVAHHYSTKCRMKTCRNVQMQCTKQLSGSRSALDLWWVLPGTVILTC